MRSKLLLAVLLIMASSCGTPFIDLEPLEIDTFPSDANQVIAAGVPIRVRFSEKPLSDDAQSLVKISSAQASVPGDFTWEGRTLLFKPVPDLVSGRRYVLEMNGQVRFADGRKATVHRVTPFFVGTGTVPLKLTQFTPADGASVASDAALTLTFDTPIDQVSFQTAFSLTPSTPHTKVWSSDGMTVTITPQTQWAVQSLYSWQVADTVTSTGGLKPPESYHRSFLVNADETLPTVTGVVPAIWAVSAWAQSGADLSSLHNGDALLIRTNREVDLPSLESAFRLTPNLKGHFLQQDETEYVFLPEEDFAAATEYQLQIDTDLRDTLGHAMAEPVFLTFTPTAPYLGVTRVDLIGTATVSRTVFNQANSFPVVSPSGTSEQIIVRIVFDADLSLADRVQFSQLSFCQPLFPTSGPDPLNSPLLTTVAFDDARTVVLTYQDFSINGTSGQPYYYQLKIPGGSGGVTTEQGQTLKEDVWIDFATGS